jgi:hypothetical protein
LGEIRLASHLFPQHYFSFWNRTRPQDDGGNILNSSADIALCVGVNYILAILFFFFIAVIAAAIHDVASSAS